MPTPSALVLITSIVYGKICLETKNLFLSPPRVLKAIYIASAAAVASSRRDALAMSIAVSSVIIVWKLRRDSRRPYEISAW
jgi:hypothetical protein